ncbi:amino acid ABC transporter permease, partial [Priestia megaterium]
MIFSFIMFSSANPSRWTTAAFTVFWYGDSTIRNIPLVVIVFFIFIVAGISGTAAGVLGLTIYTAAFIAEAIR